MINNFSLSVQLNALHRACENGHLEVVQYLVQNRAEVNAKDKFEVKLNEKTIEIFSAFIKFIFIEYRYRIILFSGHHYTQHVKMDV